MDRQVGNMSVVCQTLSRFTVFQNLLSDFVSTTEYQSVKCRILYVNTFIIILYFTVGCIIQFL